jgi:hypothetical protein
MYKGVVNVKPLQNHRLDLTFEGGEKRIFDVSKFLEIGAFRELKDERLFNSVRVSFDTVEWENGIDLDPETLYADSVPV